MRYLAQTLLLSLLALALPATASATHRVTVAPPGDSGISQYLEVVPTAQGATPPGPGGGAGGGAGGGQGGALTASQRRRLSALGPDGRTLAAVVDATAPQSLGVPVPSRAATRSAISGGRTGALGTGGPASGAQSGGGTNLRAAPASSPASLVFDAAAGSGSGGGSVWLPAFMLASLIGFTLVAVRRRRTGQ
jgi:hypothetical protein